MLIVFIILLILLAADVTAIILLTGRIKKMVEAAKKQSSKPAKPSALGPTFGKAHNIGARKTQQDSFGSTPVFQGKGMLAVVADGMGGLSGGDQVSQRIVMGMLSMASQLQEEHMDGVLLSMVQHVTQDINNMLGADGIYKSGSTVLAVLTKKDRFHWISVGDSRIYLYRNGTMLQLNQEHNLLQDWMPDILDGKMTYAEAIKNPEGKKVTSFIGMGRLKYVDHSLRSIVIAPGDRILLMTDGIFNTLSEQQMSAILNKYSDVQQAANAMEQQIKAAQIPAQDNFTVAILGF